MQSAEIQGINTEKFPGNHCGMIIKPSTIRFSDIIVKVMHFSTHLRCSVTYLLHFLTKIFMEINQKQNFVENNLFNQNISGKQIWQYWYLSVANQILATG